MIEPKLMKIKNGWAARADGWAVHAKTKEGAVAKFREREQFYKELANRPPWYANPDNPNRILLPQDDA